MPMIDKKRSVSTKGADKPKEKRRAVHTAIEFVPNAEKVPKGEPRYRDPANPFNTWSGRGKRPDWLRAYLEQGAQLSDFEI
ncbi:H-NS family nucleoid-associated regulatory protein [Burkholderia stagnalis]|uniref:H-NS histone family protein n=1 Tax=Burkholderia stagnalis TaxID=1503054 RepID=UPI00075C8E6D